MKGAWGTAVVVSLMGLAGLAQPPPAPSQERSQTPVLLSFVTPLQAPPRSWDVTGLRANLVYGESHDFVGLDIGAAGRSTGDSKGVHIALLATVTEGDAIGLQVGAANHVKGAFKGLQVGVSSYAASARGVQIGLFNGAGHIAGMQLGLINVTRTMLGFQIGVVNVVRDNDFPFLPLINGYF